MLNIIFTYNPPIPLTDKERQSFNSQSVSWVQIPEMIEGTYQAYIPSIEYALTIKAYLESKGSQVDIIGIWDDEGNQHPDYPLNKPLYLERLIDSSAGIIPVNKFGGYAERNLE